MIFKDYYKILGLETSRVSIDEIKAAYRSEAKKYHPDVNVGNKLAEERIKDINEAYRVLSVQATKRKYDRKWNSYVGQTNGKLFDKNIKSKDVIKNMFFGSEVKQEEKEEKTTNAKPQRGENIETQINATIKEAYLGADKKISLKSIDGKAKSFTVTIPEGIRNGEKIRLIGQGKPGINGGKNGDLLIKINITDSKRFKLNGYDIETSLALTPWEAALGAKVTIPTIDGETKVYIPQATQSLDIIKIPGKGYKKDKTSMGDLIVKIKIMVPKKLTDEEKDLFSKLSKISKFNARNNSTV